MENKTASLQLAKEYAFLLLKFRLRSEKELISRLKKKKFPWEDIIRVVEFLKEKKFIDDELFVKGWVDSRIKRPFGLRRIRDELKLKGIDNKIIESGIAEVKKGYCEEKIVARLVRERFDKCLNIDPEKARARVYGYMIRRGFSPETVMDAVNQIKR